MMDLIVLAEAQREATEAARWFNARRTGLGNEFLVELESVLSDIQSDPLRLPILETLEVERDYRRVRMNRFNYLVVFYVQDDQIRVVTISHAHRRPGHWLDEDD